VERTGLYRLRGGGEGRCKVGVRPWPSEGHEIAASFCNGTILVPAEGDGLHEHQALMSNARLLTPKVEWGPARGKAYGSAI
jgi:hypothetical protein